MRILEVVATAAKMAKKRAGDAVDAVGEKLGEAWDENVPFAYVVDPLKHPEDESVVTLDVPGYRQTQSYTCGYVAGMMVLHYFKPRASENSFWDRCAPDPDDGVDQRVLVRALRESGVKVTVRPRLTFEQFRRAVGSDRPVITTVKRPKTDHWVVVYGTGVNPRRIYVAGNGLPRVTFGKEVRWEEFVRNGGGVEGGLICSTR